MQFNWQSELLDPTFQSINLEYDIMDKQMLVET